MIAVALAAVGLGNDPLLSDSHAERSAAHAAHADKIRIASEHRKQVASDAHAAASNADHAALAEVAKKLAATRARLEASIAADLQSAIAEVWPAFVEQPSRLTTAAFVEPIATAARRSRECLNEEIAIAAVFVAFAASFVKASPGLASVLSPVVYTNLSDAAGNVLRLVELNAHTTHLQSALEHLEALLTTAKPSAVHSAAVDEFAVLKSVTTRTGMLAAIDSHRALVDAAAFAALPRTAGAVPGIRNVSATAT